MSYRVLIWTAAAVLLVAVVASVGLLSEGFISERQEGPVFIASNGPINEDQVREKMATDGWKNVLIKREGRYFQIMGSKDQETAHLIVDSQTGRLRGDEDDD
jgi:hypothetical protein